MSQGTGSGDMYQPGVCNIGAEERRRRRRSGHFGTGAAILFLVAIAVLRLPDYYGLASTIMFSGGAVGYLQDRLRFCAEYGRRGAFNLGGLDNDPRRVTDEAARKKDRRRAYQIFAYSAVIGVSLGVAGWFALTLL